MKRTLKDERTEETHDVTPTAQGAHADAPSLSPVAQARFREVEVPALFRCVVNDVWTKIFSFEDFILTASFSLASKWSHNTFWDNINTLRFKSTSSLPFIHRCLLNSNPPVVSTLVSISNFNDELCGLLPRFVHLTHVVLQHCPLSDAGMDSFRHLRRLEYLSIVGCPAISSRSLESLRRLHHLRVLLLIGIQISGGAFEHLRDLDLNHLAFSVPYMTDSELVHLTRLTNLETLVLSDCDSGSEGARNFECFGMLKNLKSLSLSHRVCDESHCKYLGLLDQLTNLDLFSSQLTDEGLVHCCQIPHLSSVKLGGVYSNLGLECTKKWTLTKFSIISPLIDDQGVQAVLHQRGLQEVEFKYSVITDAGVRALAALKGLRSVSLQHLAEVTDGIFDALMGMPSLTSLSITGCPGVTEGMLQRLVREHWNKGLVVRREDVTMCCEGEGEV